MSAPGKNRALVAAALELGIDLGPADADLSDDELVAAALELGIDLGRVAACTHCSCVGHSVLICCSCGGDRRAAS